jgi:subtilisin family serine protease
LDYGNPLFLDLNVAHTIVPSKDYEPLPLSDHRKVAAYWSLMDGIDDVSGHGTHCAGSAAGTPDPSSVRPTDAAVLTAVQGAAPGARLVFIDYLCQTPEGCLPPPGIIVSSCEKNRCPAGSYGIPDDYSQMFAPAYAAGARVSSNSWGEAVGHSQYTSVSAMLDSIVAGNPDFLILFSASNDGDKNAHATIEYEATAKNVLAVGALVDGLQAHMAKIDGVATADIMLPPLFGAETSRSCVALVLNATASELLPPGGCPLNMTDEACATYALSSYDANLPFQANALCYSKTFDVALCCGCSPKRILDGAAALVPEPFIFGNILKLFEGVYSGRQPASFSSKGPTLDGRIKPDLVAPGTDLISARGSGFSPTLLPYEDSACPPTPTTSSSATAAQMQTRISGSGLSKPVFIYQFELNEPTILVNVDLPLASVGTGNLSLAVISTSTGDKTSLLATNETLTSATNESIVVAFEFGAFEMGPGIWRLLLFADTGLPLTLYYDVNGASVPACFGKLNSDLRLTMTTTRGTGGAYLAAKSGTSMATPHAAGLAALVRQYFTDGFWPSGSAGDSPGFSPSAALMKAVLINSAAALNYDALAALLKPYGGPPIPLPDQRAQGGFGAVNLVRGLSFSTLGPATRASGALPTLLLPGLTTASASARSARRSSSSSAAAAAAAAAVASASASAALPPPLAPCA